MSKALHALLAVMCLAALAGCDQGPTPQALTSDLTKRLEESYTPGLFEVAGTAAMVEKAYMSPSVSSSPSPVEDRSGAANLSPSLAKGVGEQGTQRTGGSKTQPTKPAIKNIQSEHSEKIRVAKLQGYEGDPCGNCGAFTLVRNGVCLKCNTCGETSGCS